MPKRRDAPNGFARTATPCKTEGRGGVNRETPNLGSTPGAGKTNPENMHVGGYKHPREFAARRMGIKLEEAPVWYDQWGRIYRGSRIKHAKIRSEGHAEAGEGENHAAP